MEAQKRPDLRRNNNSMNDEYWCGDDELPEPGEGYVLCDRNDPDASHYWCGDAWYFTVKASSHHETTPIRKPKSKRKGYRILGEMTSEQWREFKILSKVHLERAIAEMRFEASISPFRPQWNSGLIADFEKALK